jgi:hypothetical protein
MEVVSSVGSIVLASVPLTYYAVVPAYQSRGSAKW